MKVNQAPSLCLLVILTLLGQMTLARLARMNDEEDGDNEERERCPPQKYPEVCTVIAPRNGSFPPQNASTSPWKIYTWKSTIQQFFTHPVTLGSDEGEEIFGNYILVGRALEGGQIVGHFEHQWDAIPVCCYQQGRNYSYEGPRLHPNLLTGSSARVQTPNQTVLWTAPKHFLGKVVFTATFSKSSQVYWTNVTSSPVEVIKRDERRYPFNVLSPHDYHGKAVVKYDAN